MLQIGPCSTWEKVVSNFGTPQPPPPDMLGAAGARQALHHQQEQHDPRTTASITSASRGSFQNYVEEYSELYSLALVTLYNNLLLYSVIFAPSVLVFLMYR
jgi:hypothetical protein